MNQLQFSCRIFLGTMAIIACAPLLATPAAAQPSCGGSITTNTTLTADIVGCTGVFLV